MRLTMGGEPTFVSIDDMDGAEWNLAALGPRKRGLAGILIKRLKQQFAPGGLLHFGQGKWYPGESLPRWALGCWWRRDGLPIWNDDSLIADETVDYGHGEAQARRFIMELADLLGVDPQHAIPAYEDVWHYLWRERRLPVNVDPLKSELKDEEERARLSRIFEQGLDRVVGYVLPLHRIHKPNPGAYWASGAWFLRSEHLFLIPGDSPIGYRLPLDSLPWVAPDEYPHLYEADPFAEAPPLPPRQQYLRGRARKPSRPRGAVAAQALPTAWRIGRGHRADRAVRRATGRAAARLHAAGRLDGGLSRSGCRDRRHRVDAEDARRHRRLRRRRRTAGSTTSRSRPTPA